jgi:hypothetical protein
VTSTAVPLRQNWNATTVDRVFVKKSIKKNKRVIATLSNAPLVSATANKNPATATLLFRQ